MPVPTYALYGETLAPAADEEFLHCETIEARARLHAFRIRPHRHADLCQLLSLEAGEGSLTLDGTTIALGPPCVTLIPARAVHAYSFSNAVRGHVVTLYERHLAAILRDPALAAGPACIPLGPQDARTLAAATAALAQEFGRRAPGRAAMMQAHLAVAVLTALRAQLADAAPARPRGQACVDRFCAMLDQEFARPQSVDAYAARLGITPVRLRRLCRRHLGRTPLAALNARRVAEAKQLLAFSFLSVKEVAGALGFDDHGYFSRYFVRETGLTPTAFRARPRTMAGPPPAPIAPPAGTRPGRARSRA